jgi:hypothetical protein
MAQRRDYQAEYSRRIERGQSLGLTPAQARGHPREGELSARSTLSGRITNKDVERFRDTNRGRMTRLFRSGGATKRMLRDLEERGLRGRFFGGT